MARQLDIIDIELWRDVPGWDGYQASSHGRVCRIVPETRIVYAQTPHKLTRYLDAALKTADGIIKRIGQHVLVCMTFNGPRPADGYLVAHNDGSRSNNRPSNLRWATVKENAADRVLHGTNPCGNKLNTTPLTDEDVLAIRAAYQPGYGNLTRLGERYGVSRGCIWRIVNRRNWKHI